MSLSAPEVKKQTYDRTPIEGIVVDNNDPTKCERLRIRVKGLNDNTPNNMLPWMMQDAHDRLGGGPNNGSFGVPTIGTAVYIRQQDNDPHMYLYTGVVRKTANVQSIAAVNYPNRHGWQDEKGNYFYVDKLTGDTMYNHSSGVQVHINAAGATTVTSPNPGSVTVNSEMVQINGNLGVSENVTVGNGASGTFTSEDGQIITVQDGIVTNIF